MTLNEEIQSELQTLQNKIFTILKNNEALNNENKSIQSNIQNLENEIKQLNEKYKKVYSEKGSLHQRLNITSKSLEDKSIHTISLQNEMNQYKEQNVIILEKNKILMDQNKILMDQNKILSTQLYKIQNTDEIIKEIMKKHNSWWVMDSVEEKVYRKVLHQIQEYIQEA